MLSVTVATTPAPITLSFVPKATHVALLAVFEQLTPLPAAVAAAPGVTATLEISDAG